MLGSGLDAAKLSETIRALEHEPARLPSLICQRHDDEFAWVQLICVINDLGTHEDNRWSITFGKAFTLDYAGLRELVIRSLHSTNFDLSTSDVSSTLTLRTRVDSELIAGFVIDVMGSSSKFGDLSKVEISLQYD